MIRFFLLTWWWSSLLFCNLFSKLKELFNSHGCYIWQHELFYRKRCSLWCDRWYQVPYLHLLLAFFEYLQRYWSCNKCPCYVMANFVGEIPSWLRGSLYRCGSGQFRHGASWYNHLFDGIAFLHKYAIKDGQVTYRNRKLESELYKVNEKAQRLVCGGFDQVAHPDPCKSIFNR